MTRATKLQLEYHQRQKAIRERVEAAARRHGERRPQAALRLEHVTVAPLPPAPEPMPSSGSTSPVTTLRGKISPKFLIAQVASAAGLSLVDIVGASRKPNVVRARFAAIAIVKATRPDLSLSQLGHMFGGRDHSTMHNALRKAEFDPTSTSADADEP